MLLLVLNNLRDNPESVMAFFKCLVMEPYKALMFINFSAQILLITNKENKQTNNIVGSSRPKRTKIRVKSNQSSLFDPPEQVDF